ncbi:aldo/keto reductase [[Pseudopropionibacterium] massiliense]|uniref:aldo/keto reductase n=1 Tax=[Pseudopropionibacterium] massiliense TaxID=2220000 RepID=UPI00103270CD|nr:aldo/keto reductase [[Pseudopropionibacterium] massiliense]
MEYTRLGTTDITIPRLCIGGMSFGEVFPDFHQWVIDQEATQAVIARALELGVNFIDTANVYAHGTSEEFIGASLKNLGVRREDVVLASKVYFNEGHLSKVAIEREIDGTLKRLGTDHLDLYIIHRFDYDTPVEETMETLDSLVRSGRVRALGASAMYAYQLHTMQVSADAHGWARFASMQNHYNLLYREDEREMIPVCRQYGMSLTPYSPLASGHLTRPTWDSDSVRSTTDATMRGKYDRDRETDMPIIGRVAELAGRHGVPMSDVALAWLWAKGVAAPIVGCSRPSRVDDAVRALDLTLTGEEVAFLEEPYVPHELVGPLARPGDAPLPGSTTDRVTLTGQDTPQR